MENVRSLKNIIEKEYNMKILDLFYMLLSIFVLSGIFGFLYETIFYKIDLGYFVKRGTTYGPWIPIYAFGGVFITLITHHFRRSPTLVFIFSCIISGILEFLTGYILFHYSGIRLWDYNVEIWNWGNIGGYICLRSVLFFGISGLLLMYVMMPLIQRLSNRINKKIFKSILVVITILFLVDIVISNFVF